MVIRKNMSDTKKECKCKNCNYYPFFHYTEDKYGDDIEFIKHDNNHSTVENHTTNEKYTYSNKKWQIG